MAGDKKRTVQTEFTVKDSFSGAVGRMSSSFARGAEKVSELQNRFKEFRREQGFTTLAALGLGYGIGSWIEKTKEANREFNSTQKSLAGVLSSSLKFERSASEIDRYNRSLKLSRQITDEMEETGARFNVGLGDVANSYKTVSTAAGILGLSQKQVMSLTVAAIATAKRYGTDGERAATAIARAIQTGSVRGFEPFDIKLRSVLGNMKKLTAAQRFEHVQRALQGSMEVADAMSTGIDASLNRAQVTVNALLRDATGPLFKEIATSLGAWSKKIHEIGANGRPLVEDFGSKLVTAFHALERASAFIKEHWLAIAGVRVGAALGANASKLAEWAGKIGGATVGGTGEVSKGLAGMAAKLGLAISALAAFKMALDAGLNYLEQKADERRDSAEGGRQAVASSDILKHLVDKSDGLGFTEWQHRLAQKQVDSLHHAGVVDAQGKIDKQALAYHLGNLPDQEKASLQSRFGIKNAMSTNDLNQRLAAAVSAQMEPILNQLSKPGTVVKKAADDAKLPFAKGNTIINGNVNIQMKVEEEDPDRVFLRFQQKIQDSIKRRGQSVVAEPEGL